ncbi:MAG: FtsX-like permease family protein [Eubacterium sp.]|nr:FtsX-like permease family protein [Eubacterium sp.]
MKKNIMKSYLSLIPISARTRRKQNRLTLICIILAVFLVTSVFSMAEIMTKAEEEAMITKHGSHHIILSGISQAEAEQMKGQGDVTASAWYRALGEDIYEGYQINDTRVILYGTESAYVHDIRNYETEGAYPQNDREVMLSIPAKERLGIHVGESVTIQTPAGGFDYTVTGFCMDERALYDNKFDGVCVYMSVSALDQIYAANTIDTADAETSQPVYYVRFRQNTDLREAIAGIKEQYHLSDENITENLITVGMSGASSRQDINSLYSTAAAVFVMILIAAVLMISSCMNSNVSQRTKFFGMMRCIGASKKQVMHFVRLEALNWCKSAVPIGLVLGILFSYILCIFLKNIVGGEFSEFSFRLSAVAVVSGALVGVISVLLAAHTPAKRAADVSPMAAVSGNAETGKTVSYAADTRLFKVESALGIYHAVSVRKNLILMSLSFAFTVALFLAFFAGIDFVRKILPSASDLNPDISIAAVDNANSIDRGLKEEINRLSGVEAIFGCAYALDTPSKINGAAGSVNLVSYDDWMFQWSKRSVVSGDIAKVDGDSDYALTIYNKDSRLDVGDKIQIGDTELEIACVVSEGIGVEDRPSVICTEETFQRITGEEDYIMLNIQLTKDASEETVDTLRTLAGENEFGDRREENQSNNSTFWVFRIAAYGFLTIIALIAIFNIMNSISMSVSARIRQYGAMRAIGMSVRQMTRMITAEAVTYAVCGFVVGCVLGLYLHRLIIMKLIIEHFGGVWKIPFEPIMIILLIFLFACAAAVYAPAKRMKEMSITEIINEL